ncbi:MAG: hypothetical protein M1824_002968 [Vezdaea acicularis]|nr:MAG: hypothetical protein M1824_002968 [Vezdaea acicularis]
MGIPKRNEITRFDQLSYKEFSTSWATEPFILHAVVAKWPIYENWTIDFLLSSYAEVSFRAEAVDWPLKDYIDYMYHNNDESPLYLFDRCFVEKMDLKVAASGDAIGDYWTPSCFGEDIFSLLREDRPDSRWLIIGPERSGSTFHKDPNATSAWNAVIRGSKYWLLFPPHITPPGVFVSQDKSEVTSPLSISEYLLCFHAIARETPGCIEGVCGEGELVYVPSGWWHLVVNLDPTIALTQNFVPERGIGQALRFLKDHMDQASGFKEEVINPYDLFVKRLKDRWPTWSEEGVESNRKRKWNEVVYGEIREAQDSSFSFGFGADSDEDLLG